MPDKFEEQAIQALENIKTIVEAAGLNMEHIVYVQVYLEDLGNYEKLNDVFAKYFPGTPPARAHGPSAASTARRIPRPPARRTPRRAGPAGRGAPPRPTHPC